MSATLVEPTGLLIGGTWRQALSDRTFDVENPATGEVIARVADGGPDDAAPALDAATSAQDSWAATSPRERSVILRRAFEAVIERTEELAALMTADAGLPDGVLNVVTTSDAGSVVEPWMRSGAARKISFTGSTAVGKLLLEQAASTVMRTSMELGGNAPLIVCADADLDTALDGAMVAKMRNMGEACTAANRMFVHRSVSEEFGARLANRMSALTVGDGSHEGVQVRPLIDADGRAKVQRLVDDAVSRGARILTGGVAPAGAGYFYPPTVLVDVPCDSDLMHTEIFGPVAAIAAFDDEYEVVRVANDTDWGLVGYVFTRDVDRAFDLSERLEVGMVGVNTGLVSNPAAPFGGVEQSGLGREGGRTGIDEFLETKYFAVPRRAGR